MSYKETKEAIRTLIHPDYRDKYDALMEHTEEARRIVERLSFLAEQKKMGETEIGIQIYLVNRLLMEVYTV